MASAPLVLEPQPNSDESTITAPFRYIGNFHKTLPHDGAGHVDVTAYQKFVDIAAEGNFESVAEGMITGGQPHVAKLINPQCGRATDTEGPDPLRVEMQPAPGVLSQSAAAEMTELQWMAWLRDLNFDTWGGSADVGTAISELNTRFKPALSEADPGHLMAQLDIPTMADGVTPDINLQTLFRAGLKGEDAGPLVSQFMLLDCDYGAQRIEQTMIPYRAGADYLTALPEWLAAQDSGYDKYGHDYLSDNNYGSDPSYYPNPLARVRIRNMRDLARFVNRDALHQAYFNAALQLLSWGAPVGSGNPYTGYVRQLGFGTLGGPNLLALVTEVASRALKVVWRQKWLVHRRLRPEAYGGLMHNQFDNSAPTNYGLPAWLPDTAVSENLFARNQTHLFPIAYSAGSPAHPSYGAGHASVAGACVTILKAWFADVSFQSVIAKASAPSKDPSLPPQILQPGTNRLDGSLPPYSGADIGDMTVHGELNKLAANVALGRSMGGVHWRSDNTRSLRLGERVAIVILRRSMPTYPEGPLSLSFVNFDREMVTIDHSGEVTVAGNQPLTDWFNSF